MTSHRSDTGTETRYLVLDHGNTEFLVPRHFCVTSIHTGGDGGIMKSRPGRDVSWFLPGSPLRYRGSELPVFDLDGFLADSFRTGGGGEFPVAFLCPLVFLPPALTSFLGRDGKTIPGWVAFLAGREPGLSEAPDMHPWTGLMARILPSRGVEGCSFPSGKVRYLINPARILHSALHKEYPCAFSW